MATLLIQRKKIHPKFMAMSRKQSKKGSGILIPSLQYNSYVCDPACIEHKEINSSVCRRSLIKKRRQWQIQKTSRLPTVLKQFGSKCHVLAVTHTCLYIHNHMSFSSSCYIWKLTEASLLQRILSQHLQFIW